MEKLYGDQIRKEAGLTKTLRTATQKMPTKNLKPSLHVPNILFTTTASIKNLSIDTASIRNNSEELNSAITDDTDEISEYRLKLSHLPVSSKSNNRFTLGERIKLDWYAPLCHGPKDWIGIYRVTANPRKEITSVRARGKWFYVNAISDDKNDELLFPPQVQLKTHGTIIFSGEKLPWHEGTYEIRYHHDGLYNVMAKSIPFEIIGKP